MNGNSAGSSDILNLLDTELLLSHTGVFTLQKRVANDV